MHGTRRTGGLAVLLLVVGCSRPGIDSGRSHTPPPEARASFVNRVWSVAESSGVAPGHLYVFLSEGTLVVASPYGKPSLGTWSRAGDTLTIVEEGIPYRTGILSLSSTEFRIRSHNPGEPVEIRFVPAE